MVAQFKILGLTLSTPGLVLFCFEYLPILFFRKMKHVYDFVDGPLEIRSGIQLIDVDIDSENSAVYCSVFFQFFWIDRRIRMTNVDEVDGEMVNVDPSLIEKIWLPNLYFYDLRSFKKHELFRDVQGGIRLKRKEANVTGQFFWEGGLPVILSTRHRHRQF